MGIPSEMRDAWAAKRKHPLFIASPSEDEWLINSRNCTQVDCLSYDTMGQGKPQLYCSGTHHICCIYRCVLHYR